MKYMELNEDEIKQQKDGVALKFLYSNVVGRCALRVLVCPKVSKMVGKALNTSASKPLIAKYKKKYKIDVGNRKFKSFNDFFKRKNEIEFKEKDKNKFVATADSRITCYDIDENLILNVKQSKYTIEELVQDVKIAEQYKGGLCIVYRLIPSDYHRYIFVDSGKQTMLKKIQGKLHTVNPISYKRYKVFSENTREVSMLDTDNFGRIVQIEVGALCVGKIQNNDCKRFKRYQEKGYFEFGGSTIIHLIEKDRIILKDKIINNTVNNVETKVSIGDVIGNKFIGDKVVKEEKKFEKVSCN